MLKLQTLSNKLFDKKITKRILEFPEIRFRFKGCQFVLVFLP